MTEPRIEDYLAGAERATLVGPFLANQPERFLEPVLFVDGGARFRRDREGFSVGDGDSSAAPLDQKIAPEKDFSDFAYALSLLPASVRIVIALGFYGGRFDHTLANLGEACAYAAAVPQRELHFDNFFSVYAPGSWIFDVRGSFSLFVLETTELMVHGECRYAMAQPKKTLPLSSHGLSNEGYGKIGVHSNRSFVLVRNY